MPYLNAPAPMQLCATTMLLDDLLADVQKQAFYTRKGYTCRLGKDDYGSLHLLYMDNTVYELKNGLVPESDAYVYRHDLQLPTIPVEQTRSGAEFGSGQEKLALEIKPPLETGTSSGEEANKSPETKRCGSKSNKKGGGPSSNEGIRHPPQFKASAAVDRKKKSPATTEVIPAVPKKLPYKNCTDGNGRTLLLEQHGFEMFLYENKEALSRVGGFDDVSGPKRVQLRSMDMKPDEHFLSEQFVGWARSEFRAFLHQLKTRKYMRDDDMNGNARDGATNRQWDYAGKHRVQVEDLKEILKCP